ncbi:EamA-like transporter family protein [Candidatus Nanopelagicus hibericus]|uniref:EamA-like transporter family protein n=1 Tax=Candidatus Nanopelagicus hibericus TaxID=1884915 RepID=A0A249K908_9ACTN|nr:DMT family transporter [Candidatus Nanopelagicus hibericus]ASY13264.1 EamA-like transporter family protein [Candidatus Nanopelagicus hibericus]
MKAEISTKFTILALLWGVSFLLLLRVVEAFDWAAAISVRAFIASGSVLLLAAIIRKKLDFSIGVKHFAILGLTSVTFQLIGLSLAVPRIGTALTAILVGAIPLFSSVIGRLMKIENIDRSGFIGLLLGFVGIIFLVGFPSGEFGDQFFLGFFVCLFGCMSAAFGSNYSKLKMSSVGNWEQVIGAFFFGGLFTSPILLFVPIKAGLVPMDWLYMVSLAVFCSAFCYVIYFSLVSKIGATRSISVEFLVTVVAVLIGAFYLNEAITVIQLFGAALVILGSILILDLLSISKK